LKIRFRSLFVYVNYIFIFSTSLIIYPLLFQN